MGKIVGLAIMVVLAGFTAGEIARYQRARRLPDELPYPRRRLSRRMGIAAIFIATVGLLTFWPVGPAWLQLALLVALLGAMGVAFVLLLRDLRETSLEAVRYANQMDSETGRQLEAILRGEAPPRKPDPPAGGE